jgi:acetyl-CoA C-acetyltransferase
MIAVKNHLNGSQNPKAHLRREVTMEQVMNAPIIAWPLGLFDCCGTSDGAAAAIMCRSEDANSFRKDWITFKGFGLSVGPAQGDINTEYDYTHWEETKRAAVQAYNEAGINNPRKQLSMIECHDCFTIAELIALESMGVCEPGKGRFDVETGSFLQSGEIPVNLSGGLKSFGHPVGASGCRETYEVYKQLQGKAELPSRQLKNVNMGLVHNQGGVPGAFQCGVAIMGRPKSSSRMVQKSQ